jgi:hypothetical protein
VILERTTKFDPGCAELADQHYSRRAVGSPQFMPPGWTLVLRDAEGMIVFGWCRQKYRADGQNGVCCTIFRNESEHLSSLVILEAEKAAVERWGPVRGFTYVDPRKVRSENPGCCFKMAGWKFVEERRGKLLFEKFLS